MPKCSLKSWESMMNTFNQVDGSGVKKYARKCQSLSGQTVASTLTRMVDTSRETWRRERIFRE